MFPEGHRLQPQPLSDPITEEDGEASKGENENDVKVFVCVHACVRAYISVGVLLFYCYSYRHTSTRDSRPAGNYVTTLKQIEKMDDSTFLVSAVL